jgi:hypothetical protein
VGIAKEAARARVHCPDEHEARRKYGRTRRPRDPYAPFLNRLPQHLEDMTSELWHLVEKEDAVMGQANLAGPGILAAANQRDV